MNTPLRMVARPAAALALALATLPLLAQSSTDAPTASQALTAAPVLARLPYPLDAATTRALEAEGIRLLHHYGAGRYLLSAHPRNLPIGALSAAELAQAALAQRPTVADQRPDLADAIATERDARRRTLARPADDSNTPTSQPTSARLGPVDQADRSPSGKTAPDARHSTVSPTAFPIELVLAYPGAATALGGVLATADFRQTGHQVEGGTTLAGLVTAAGLARLLAEPLVLDACAPAGEPVPYNFEARITHNATALNSGIPGAPHLNGAGVVVGIGDGGQLGGHPDIGNRVVHSTTYYNSGWGAHPDMVAGIVGGGGIVDPRHRGTAAEAELVIEGLSLITHFAPTYLRDYGMSLTNNSYGPSFHCTTAGRYYSASATIDQQLRDNPSLLHVYAAGNSGRGACAPYPTGYLTMPSGPQCAKNTLSVANAYPSRELFASSSAGPTFDGRLKPDLAAVGSDVTSTDRTGAYATGSGTSYAAPAAVGVLALLTEHYRALHGGSLPDGALLKAVACNTATDLGRPGPDYRYGFGLLDGTAALEALSHAHYRQAALAPGTIYTETLPVAAGTEDLAVLLYWHDAQGATQNLRKTLIQDLDLAVVTPAGDTLRPWVLDPSLPELDAQRGLDTLNNAEQVTLANPSPGAYTLVVRARALPLGTHPFVLTWRLPQPAVQLTCPFGGETVSPGQPTYVAWSASPGQTGTWTVEYAPAGPTAKGGGGTAAARGAWHPIVTAASPETRTVLWTPPAGVGAYVVRVTNDASGLTDATDAPVGVLATPTALGATPICNGDMRLAWQPVPGAVGYDVFRFDGARMASAGTVTDTVAFLSGLALDKETLFSVRARGPGDIAGQRAYAIAQTPRLNGVGCHAPLPVSWTAVRTENRPSGVAVVWSVATEYNNDYFEVERGTPAGDSVSWTPVARVTGRGTAATPAEFSALDEAAPAAGVLYYRVAQQDLDGIRAYSEVVAHTRGATAVPRQSVATAVTLSQNPVVGDLRFTLQSERGATVTLHDAAGRPVGAFAARPGANAVAWPAQAPRGFYVMRVTTLDGESSVVKLVRG